MRRKTKISWKKLLIKATENGIRKAIELVFLAIVLGAALKLVLVAVPGIVIGSVIAKTVKLKLLE